MADDENVNAGYDQNAVNLARQELNRSLKDYQYGISRDDMGSWDPSRSNLYSEGYSTSYDARSGFGARSPVKGAEMAYDPTIAQLGTYYQDMMGRHALPFKDASADARNQNMQLLDLLNRAARGETPSAAAELMKGAVDQNIRGTGTMMAGARGGNFAGVANTFGEQANDQFLSSISGIGAMRADEMAQARDLYASTLAATEERYNQMVQFYTSLGLSADEANRSATMRLAQMQANVATGNAALDHQRTMGGLQMGMQAASDLFSAIMMAA